MADMYLTKKERTTLYTEGFIYSLVVVFASYYTIHGGLFVKMIPMLFLLGIVGRCIFDKPKTTIVFGTIAFIITAFMTQFKIDLNLILVTFYSAFMILLGLQVGKILRTLYYSYKLRIFIGYNKKTMNIFGLIFLTILAVFLNSIVNSNPVQYILAKNKTDKYIKQTYLIDKYVIESVSYNIKNRGGYTFNTVINGKDVVLVHRTLDSIEDTNLEQRKLDVSKYGNKELDRWKEQNNIDKEIILDGIYNYSRIGLEPDMLEINIQTHNDDNRILIILDCINKLRTFNQYDKINSVKINIGGKSMTIKKEKMIDGITEEYIQKGLEIEYLD